LDGEQSVLQACRLASLLFSSMVIFPLPATQGVLVRLAMMLRQVLEQSTMLCVWEMHHHLLVWMLTLGAIGASFTPDRAWYVDQLTREVAMLGIQSWSTLESMCLRFLWWTPVCSEPGEVLWTEMFPPIIDHI
jgi:hypothetical protein